MFSITTRAETCLNQQKGGAAKRSFHQWTVASMQGAQAACELYSMDDEVISLQHGDLTPSIPQNDNDSTMYGMEDPGEHFPRQKKIRREDNIVVGECNSFSRTNSESSMTSSAPRQSGHKKVRNRAFTGEDFQRLIISQF